MTLVVTPCLVEGEPYAEHSRKLAVIFFAAICVNALFLGVPLTVVVSTYDPNLLTYLVGSAFVVVSITASFIPYIYLRYTRTMPQWMVDFQVWSTLPAIVLVAVSLHQGPSLFILACMMSTAVLLRVRLWYLYTVVITLNCLLTQLVVNYSGELPALKQALYREQLLSERLIILVGFLVAPAVFMSIAMNRLMAEFVQRADQADAAIAMNLAVADKLRRYDTDGVSEILAAHAGRVDAKLLEAFAAIQHNLQEYRPHIPDYIIAATTTLDGDEEDGVATSQRTLSPCQVSEDSEGDMERKGSSFDTSMCTRDVPSPMLPHPHDVDLSEGSFSHSNISVSQNAENGGFARIPRSNNNSTMQSLHCPSPVGPQEGGGVVAVRSPVTASPHVQATPSSDERSGRRKSLMTSSEHSSTKRGGDAGVANANYSGRATTVFIRFLVPSCHKAHTAKGNRDTIMAALNYCVESAARHAKAHHGALQYMQGCGLMVSFNAASRVVSHESKACSFVLALRDDTVRFEGPTLLMHATLVTSNIVSFFAGNKGQLMLTVLGDYMTQHTTMHQYLAQTLGTEHTCILASERSVSTVEAFFAFRWLGAVAAKATNTRRQSITNGFMQTAGETPHPPTQPLTLMIELVAKRKEDVAQEWMYELAKQDDGDPHVAVKRVVEAAIRGHIAEDYHKLGCGGTPDVSFREPQTSGDVVLERCVKSRLSSCVDHPSDFIVQTPSIDIW